MRRNRKGPSLIESARRSEVIQRTLVRIGAEGLTNRQAAEKIGIGDGTLRNVISREVPVSADVTAKCEAWLAS